MKIAIISPYDLNQIWPGQNFYTRPVTWTHNLAKELSKIDGNEVHIISGISPKINLEKYMIKKGNLYYHFFKTSGRISPYILYIYEITKIKIFLNKIKPHIVHGQGLENYSGLAAILSGYPNIITIHGILNEIYSEKKSKYIINKSLEKFAMYLSKNIIIINPYVKNILKKYLKKDFKKKNMFFISNPVSKKFFNCSNDNTKNDSVKILYTGVFRPRKGLMDLLNALIHVKIKTSRFKLYIAGIKPNDEESLNFFNDINDFCNKYLKSNSEILGFIHPSNMADLMSKMDFLVLPSKADTAPMVISEAMASGIPVIAYDVGGIRYMIKNGITGYIVPLNDKVALQKKIEKLIINKELRKNMGKKAREEAEKLYYPTIVARKTLKIYKEILSNYKGN